jgi:hypothetical protein
MCIRAFDSLPPVDITFGDYLRALVTADFELNPEDEWGQRSALIEGFRRRGIYPEGVTSLSEESLRWPIAAKLPPLTDNLERLLPQLLKIEADRFSERSRGRNIERGPRPSLGSTDDEAKGPPTPSGEVSKKLAIALNAYATANAKALSLRPDLRISTSHFNAVFRTTTNGRLLIELVAQLIQTDPQGEHDALLGGIAVRGGTTIVVGVDGTIRYAIAKPLPGKHLSGSLLKGAQARLDRQKAFVSALDGRDPLFPYMSGEQLKSRMRARMSIRGLHRGF